MNFEEALTALHAGKRVRRKDWDPGVCILQSNGGFIIWELPDAKLCNTIPFTIFDFDGEDWEIVNG